MTKEEQIRIHLSKIRFTATPGRIWSISDIVLDVQEELDAIKDLLQPEPETLVSSVLRLTDLCNRLEAENHRLKQELDAVTRSNAFLRERLSFAECSLRACRDAVAVLKEEVARQNVLLEQAESLQADLDAVTRSNEQARRVKYLEQARSAGKAYIQRLMNEIRNLKHDLARREGYTKARQEHIKNLNQDFDAVTQDNVKLMQQINMKNQYIELLKQDRRTLRDERRNS